MHRRKAGEQSVREFQQDGNGIYNLQDQQLHINVLELKAVKAALLVYHKQFQMKAIHFQLDNTKSYGIRIFTL